MARSRTLTALGGNTPELWAALLEGRDGLSPVVRFPTDRYISSVAAQVGALGAVDGEDGRSRFDALLDLALDGFGPVPSGAWLATATTKGKIDALERQSRGRPYREEDLLPAATPEAVARRLGLDATRASNINAACASSTVAVAQAATRIAAGRVDAAVVFGGDLLTEFVFSGFSALHALSPGGCRPFDRDRDGLTLGEGAFALLLVGDALRDAEKHPPEVRIAGWGVANDAHHITAPDPRGSGLQRAVRDALATAGRDVEDLCAVCAHGTGTVYNDAMELAAFRAVFRASLPPMFSIKGAIGHTLGAAGGIEVAVAEQVLLHRKVPPTARLCTPDPASSGCIATTPVTTSGDHVLTTNSGFGGVNAALVLSRGASEGMP